MRGVHFQFLKIWSTFWGTFMANAEIQYGSEGGVERVLGEACCCARHRHVLRYLKTSTEVASTAPVPLSDRSSTKRPHRPSRLHIAPGFLLIRCASRSAQLHGHRVSVAAEAASNDGVSIASLATLSGRRRICSMVDDHATASGSPARSLAHKRLSPSQNVRFLRFASGNG